jgi:hypothetical protein
MNAGNCFAGQTTPFVNTAGKFYKLSSHIQRNYFKLHYYTFSNAIVTPHPGKPNDVRRFRKMV